MNNDIKRKFPLSLDIQWFAEEPPADPPQDPPAPPKKLEMTQEEFDAKIADRLARERKKFADYDDIKTKLSDHEKAEEERRLAAMSEKERLEAEKKEALELAQTEKEAREKATTAANQRLIKSEFRALARELGIRPDALDDAHKLADLSAVSVDDDGNVVGVKDVIEALVKDKPYLAEQAKKEAKSIGNPSNPPQPNEIKTLEQQLEEAKQKRDFSKVIELSNKIKALLRN
ncbi:phage scaffolding protein [Paenibacillus planticolens]|uniref:Scaffolding protein n=1 Tax=Paenibacillus planticolens TaxID=2654976 RepID=A0ABX1ZI25_9BACL|nr:scaffolding protein [Paenibacillus planticolens]NOU98476.1 scaffolding protein [Paenibacillus planticolens]